MTITTITITNVRRRNPGKPRQVQKLHSFTNRGSGWALSTPPTRPTRRNPEGRNRTDGVEVDGVYDMGFGMPRVSVDRLHKVLDGIAAALPDSLPAGCVDKGEVRMVPSELIAALVSGGPR